MQLEILDLGLVDFKDAWRLQKEALLAVKNNTCLSRLILCQHYPVITLGRSANKRNLLYNETALAVKGIPVYEVERGGDVTYHGPGQITVYPIFNLNYFKKDIHLFLRNLENLIIDLLAGFGINGIRYPGLTGVWIRDEKIASIGIAIKNWITFHGISLNIKSLDLENFNFIRPCGMDIKMTSLENILRKQVEIQELKDIFVQKFRKHFSFDLVNQKYCLSAVLK